MSRREITDILHTAAKFYLVKKMFSVHHEVGILPWGKRKTDVFAFSSKLDVVICEVKSCAADFDSDKKFHEYIPYSHLFYFVVGEGYWNSAACNRMREAAKLHGAGILVLVNGRLESKQKAVRRTELPKGFIKTIITKLAWRGGSHRGNTRCRRLKH